MTKIKILGAAAVVATALAGPAISPAMAQEVIYNPGYCAPFYPNANCENKGPGNPYTGDYQRRLAYRDDGYRDRWNNDLNNGWHERNDNPFTWPGDVAAGAIGTASGIATAPFRAGNAYAHDNGHYGNRIYGDGYAHSDYYANAHAGDGWNKIYSNTTNNSYAARNGFVCAPGSFFRGDDGRRHRCQ